MVTTAFERTQDDSSRSNSTGTSQESSRVVSGIAFPQGSLPEIFMDKAALLEISDKARTHLRDKRHLGPEADRVISLLQASLHAEMQGRTPIGLDIVKYSRFDKLAQELSNSVNSRSPLTTKDRQQRMLAGSLLRAWRNRFREQWFSLDDHRTRLLTQSGRMRDVVYCGENKDNMELWRNNAECCEPSPEVEYEPGCWWLNLACAHRDGIVGSDRERPTKGRWGFAALPLLTGTEVCLREGVSEYIREGTASDMHFSLITQVGKQVRLLRGYRLKSLQAPSAGVRYDGLYTISQLGIKLFLDTDKHRMVLRLERVGRQKPMVDVLKIPWPSQLDEWILFENHEAEMVKQLNGDRGYTDLKLRKDAERVDRQH